MDSGVEQKIFEELNQISRQLKQIQRSLDRLDAQHRQQEPGMAEGIRKTRLKARQQRSDG
jgi:hypothetical protein